MAWLLVLATLLSAAWASKFPCHESKLLLGTNVTCSNVQLPPNLCTSCPLKEPKENGDFKQCWDIFDTTSFGCLATLEEYAEANKDCDPIRHQAIKRLNADWGDWGARSILDNFLYSVCEQCCDCIPMSAELDSFSNLSLSHSESEPALYDVNRGNCPAHAFYDICNIYPNIASFSVIGEEPPANRTPICDSLFAWFDSHESHGWETNPRTQLTPNVTWFLNNVLNKTQCTSDDVWVSCFDLEYKQKNIGEHDNIYPSDEPESSSEPELSVIDDPLGIIRFFLKWIGWFNP